MCKHTALDECEGNLVSEASCRPVSFTNIWHTPCTNFRGGVVLPYLDSQCTILRVSVLVPLLLLFDAIDVMSRAELRRHASSPSAYGRVIIRTYINIEGL